MKKFLTGVLSLVAMVSTPFAVNAQELETPIITFHTNIFDTYGAGNTFHITLGATEPMWIDYDCGYGLCEEYIEGANFDSDLQEMTGTPISMQVSRDGIVKIYGDASKIDYIDFEGCYISDIQWPELTNVAILNLQHNELTSLDLSHMTKLQALWVDDNPFTRQTPFILGPNHPELVILSMNMIDHIDPNFDINTYTKLVSFSAHSSLSLSKLTPSGCPDLRQISIDGSAITEIDVTQNPYLLILNVSETRITDLDLSKNPYLTELYIQHEAALNNRYKFTKLDVSNNPELVRLYLNGNAIKELDLSNNPKINSLGCRRNMLTALNFDNNPKMALVDISLNYMNFNTMPLPSQVFGGDYQYEQYPIPVNRSYPVGGSIDFKDQVIRSDGSETAAGLFAINPEDPGNPELLDESYFTFEDGKITFNASYPDSVYIAFHNTAFAEYDLTTARFMIKEADEYGQPSLAVMMRTPSAQSDIHFSVGIDGATPENPIEFFVDFGDGQRKPFAATSATYSDIDNVSGTRGGLNTIIYMPENADMTALRVSGVRLSLLSVSEAAMLRELKINNCGLSAIGLEWNRCLSSLDLSYNNLESISLAEPNAYYTKTVLGDINLSHNKLSDMTLVDPYTYRNINVSDNKLTSIVTDHTVNMLTLDVSNNQLTELSLSDCESLRELNASGNQLTELTIPSYTPLSKLNIAGNNIALPQLPLPSAVKEYIYAPQQPVAISTKAPTVNLTAYNLDVNGSKTAYEWHMASDSSVVPEGNITEKDGIFLFDNPDLGLIYCTITHPSFPDFVGRDVLTTTNVLTAAPPTHTFATLTPNSDGKVELRMACVDADNNYDTDDTIEVYVDWGGNGDLQQYIVHQQYGSYEGMGVKDVQARFYSYADNDGVSIFSVTGDFKHVDGSLLTDVTGFYVTGFSGDSENLIIPRGTKLRELVLNNSGLKSLDLSGTPSIEYLALNKNNLKKLDVSMLKRLGCLYLDSNPGIEVTMNNPMLWELSLTNCELESIDLTGCPSMQQLWLTNNNLSSIDVSMLSNLRILVLSGNKFDFTTLPLPKDSYLRYDYGSQAPIEIENSASGKIDLSKYASRDGVETLYRWFIDMPYLDDYGELQGEELYVDDEYSVTGGVTVFHYPIDRVMCVLTNSLFPNLYMYTNLINVTAAGIDEVFNDINTGAAEYYNLQGVRVTNPGPGIYIKRQGDITTKVFIKR